MQLIYRAYVWSKTALAVLTERLINAIAALPYKKPEINHGFREL